MPEDNIPTSETEEYILSYATDLAEYAAKHQTEYQTAQIDDSLVSVLGSADDLDLEEIANQEKQLTKDTPPATRRGYCGAIASYACGLGFSDGVLSGENGIKDSVINQDSHFISYKKLPDNTFITLDWSLAQSSIHDDASNVLVIRADNYNDMITKVTSYYGGEWHAQRTDITKATAEAYYSKDPQIKDAAKSYLDALDKTDAA